MDRIGDWSPAELRRFIVNQILTEPGVVPSMVTQAALATSLAAAGGRLLRVDAITSGVSYIAPPTAKSLYIECVGGGGAGGGATGAGGGNVSAGGGGGGGAYAATWLTANVGEHVVVVGAGGATGGVAANGNPGADTSFKDAQSNMVCLAKGGLGGDAAGATTAARAYSQGALGGAASSCTGDLKIDGGPGTGASVIAGGNANLGSIGGGSAFGFGARNQYTNVDSDGLGAFANSGGGGGGAMVPVGSFGRSGGAGGSGLIRVWAFA